MIFDLKYREMYHLKLFNKLIYPKIDNSVNLNGLSVTNRQVTTRSQQHNTNANPTTF